MALTLISVFLIFLCMHVFACFVYFFGVVTRIVHIVSELLAVYTIAASSYANALVHTVLILCVLFMARLDSSIVTPRAIRYISCMDKEYFRLSACGSLAELCALSSLGKLPQGTLSSWHIEWQSIYL